MAEQAQHTQGPWSWSHYTDRAVSGRFTCRWSQGRVAALIGKKLICIAPTFALAQAACERYAAEGR